MQSTVTFFEMGKYRNGKPLKLRSCFQTGNRRGWFNTLNLAFHGIHSPTLIPSSDGESCGEKAFRPILFSATFQNICMQYMLKQQRSRTLLF